MNNFSKQITSWYSENKRDLPWRNTKNPYFIWLSEIILQQTRVNQGMDYYLKFIQNFPIIEKLAAANSEKVMKLWQGLGYYSRARNLHETAKFIVKNHRGTFPADYNELKKLKGIGNYTAAAISSFAYGLPHAVVDGNVYRVLARYLGSEIPINSPKGRKYFAEKAHLLLDKKNPALHNQAIMEFGAMQCIPKNPDCKNCVLQKHCIAYQTGKTHLLPTKIKKNKIKTVFLYYLVIKLKNKYYLKKRNANSIWKYLYDFPLMESDKKISDKKIIQLLSQKYFRSEPYQLKHISDYYKHSLSHRNINAKFFLFEPKHEKLTSSENLVMQTWQKLPKLAVPRLIEKYLTDIFALQL